MNHKLPSLSDLKSDNEPQEGALLSLLCSPVNEVWLKTLPERPDYKFLPIDRVRLMLRKLFGTYRVEVVREGYMSGNAFVSVKVHFFNPDTQKDDYWSGDAACEIQGKTLKAALPIAISDAIKDACGIWPLFGSELNKDRKSEVPKDAPEKWKKLKAQFDRVEEHLPSNHILGLQNVIENQIEAKYAEAYRTINYYDPLKKKTAQKPKKPTKKPNSGLL